MVPTVLRALRVPAQVIFGKTTTAKHFEVASFLKKFLLVPLLRPDDRGALPGAVPRRGQTAPSPKNSEVVGRESAKVR